MIHRFVVPLAALVLLAGCTALGPTSPDVHGTADPQSTVTQPVEIPNGVIATGALVGIAGEQLGEVRIVKDGYDYRFEAPEFVTFTDERPMTLALSDSPFDPAECGNANIWQMGVGDEATFQHGVPASTFASGDWSFFTSVVVVGHLEPADGTDLTECVQRILATAPLTWDQPVVRPWVDPVDSGAASGANGTVDGTLYTTAPGDVWDAIAARFGISGSDLEWLNPIRTPGTPKTAYEGQLLNLDPDDRSDSESRRPQ
jgi:hypothetical protein